MTKHTPAPWAVEQGEGPHEGWTIITARHAAMDARSPLAQLSNLLGPEETAADAILIAAAPELLEMVRTQHDVIDKLFAMLIVSKPGFMPTKTEAWSTVAKAHALIAKAEGRT